MEVESFGATGEKEVVAGIQGEVYEIRWRDEDGRTHTDQAVLSDNPLAVELTSVMHEVARTYAEAMDREHSGVVEDALSARGLGILRYGDMRLTEISGESPVKKPSRYRQSPWILPVWGAYPEGVKNSLWDTPTSLPGTI